MYGDKYRSCPIDRTKLAEKLERVENGTKWEVYTCKTCGSEVWLDSFKDLRERYSNLNLRTRFGFGR